jgi:hypothetical protein
VHGERFARFATFLPGSLLRAEKQSSVDHPVLVHGQGADDISRRASSAPPRTAPGKTCTPSKRSPVCHSQLQRCQLSRFRSGAGVRRQRLRLTCAAQLGDLIDQPRQIVTCGGDEIKV